MKVTLSPSYLQHEWDDDDTYYAPVVTIEVERDDLTICQVVDNLICPALLAYGFSEEIVNRIIIEEKPEVGF